MGRTLVGIVSSNKTDKTIVVTVQTAKTHPVYKKQYTISTKFMAHDKNNEAEIGDKVAIVETRPLSARKRFTLDRIIQKPVLREVETFDKTDEEEQKPAASSPKRPAKTASEKAVEETEE